MPPLRMTRCLGYLSFLLWWAVLTGKVTCTAAEDGSDDALAEEDYVPAPPPPAADEPIPDKVGAEVHLSKKERSALKKLECGMCQAILREMHVEVARHKMTQKGVGSESQIWETSNAMCLALLQKYRLDLTGPKPKLEPKSEEEEEELMMSQSQSSGMDYMRSMLVLKMGCQSWLEDYGGDTSGFIYKAVKDKTKTADSAAIDYCANNVGLCGKSKKEQKKKEKEAERARLKQREAMINKQETEEKKDKEKDPFSSLPEDSKFGLQRMLEMARDDPLHYMEDDAKERVQKARAELRCEVCRVALEEAHGEVMKRPKSMRSESDILSIVEGACSGGADLSVPSYFGVEPPPLPPVWTDSIRPQVQKKSGRYTLKPYAKKAGKERRKWRQMNKEGKHKPPPSGENEADMMLTLACKDMLEPARMAEELYAQMAACGSDDARAKKGCAPPLSAARKVCKTAEAAVCTFESATNSEGRKEEEL